MRPSNLLWKGAGAAGQHPGGAAQGAGTGRLRDGLPTPHHGAASTMRGTVAGTAAGRGRQVRNGSMDAAGWMHSCTLGARILSSFIKEDSFLDYRSEHVLLPCRPDAGRRNQCRAHGARMQVARNGDARTVLVCPACLQVSAKRALCSYSARLSHLFASVSQTSTVLVQCSFVPLVCKCQPNEHCARRVLVCPACLQVSAKRALCSYQVA